jgi:hypothetical protein
MAITDVLTYLAALFLPLWLGAEQILAWWALRNRPAQAGSEEAASDGVGEPASAASKTPKVFTRKAA